MGAIIISTLSAQEGDTMQELNNDGLVPGQQVDYDTLRKIELARKTKQEVQHDEPPAGAKPARKTRKQSANGEA